MWGSILGPWDYDLSLWQTINQLSPPGAPSPWLFTCVGPPVPGPPHTTS